MAVKIAYPPPGADASGKMRLRLAEVSSCEVGGKFVHLSADWKDVSDFHPGRTPNERTSFSGVGTKGLGTGGAHSLSVGRCDPRYIAIDSTGVRQQGPQGAKADGRMAYVGMIFNPLPDRERVFEGLPQPGESMRARYVSGLYPLAGMGPLLRRQGGQVGLDHAETWVAISDGGVGLEEFLRMNFPRVEAVILDFYHASEYLAKLSTAAHPTDEAAALAQTKRWSRLLRDEGGETMISVLEEWDWPPSKGLATVRDDGLTYFRNQIHRMDYPTYEANGWFIGSGAVESACKTVVGQRLKGSGMRWSESGGHAVCHVRALYRSECGQWDAFWDRVLAA